MPTDRCSYKDCLMRSEEELEVATFALNKSKCTAAVINPVHCATSAIDALSVHELGKRRTGGHAEALRFVKATMSEGEHRDISKQYSGLLMLENEAERQPDPMTERQARDAMSRASRIPTKVEGSTSSWPSISALVAQGQAKIRVEGESP